MNFDPLRDNRGGRLRVETRAFGGDLLPRNNDEEDCQGQTTCFLAGDGRANEQPNLAVMHTLFVREHNRIAQQLVAMNSHWDNERVYQVRILNISFNTIFCIGLLSRQQEARRVLNAEYQHIVYNEFLPALLGQQYMDNFGLLPLTDGYSNDYRDDFVSLTRAKMRRSHDRKHHL